MRSFVREGDTVFCHSMDRLARNLDALRRMGAVAQFERELIRERQREGITIAKREEKYIGRKPSLHQLAQPSCGGESLMGTRRLRLNQRPRKTLGFQTPAARLQASVASTV
jgi:DNA invertase Pin-like site-specific DNA recombinase